MKAIQIPNWSFKLEWSDFLLEHVMDPSIQHWPRSSTPPVKNSLRIVRAPLVVVQEKTMEFWGIFAPALSYFNGWDEYLDEIDGHRMYKAKIIEVLKVHENNAWVILEIIDSIPFQDINTIIAAEPMSHKDFLTDLYEPQQYKKFKNWLTVNFSAEGDLGYELLFEKHRNHYSLIYYYQWDFSEEKTFIFNKEYTEEAIESWLRDIK